ncbi:conjugal transfer ATPase TrbE [Thiorhodovibrio winogradskyi]|uniref:Conjugal transfer ATPase TrbE n=1 Tax=Thiorhodovibrio winogradskyi TaxID=77007 RepID=A0ABZ0S9D4_9GAMM|nr:helicase HerA-like domain-containing protein [Thiorhodovibrio winogradskyi]
MPEPLLIGKSLIGDSEHVIWLRPDKANRHGLIAGATGTGKTVTLQALAEQFSRIGVPVFMADVKGDLAGISQAGGDNTKVAERVRELDLEALGFRYDHNPVSFWDIGGSLGHPARTTVSEMGPMLLARLLGLNDTQEGVLNICFHLADEQGLLLLDLKDLRAILNFASEQADALRTTVGHVSQASVGAILRRLLRLEQAGAEALFGEPALDLADLMQTDIDGRGVVNILVAETLIHNRTLYASFLLWLLSELFEQLPEVGDPDKPKFVLFFDEAHLLFDDAPEVLVERIEQVVRLIRSKGVGVYFVTQNPLDIPDTVLGQLGNRVQHALRAFTPRDQKAVRAAAQTFRQNPAIDTESAITSLGVGEALVSVLDDDGIPTPVERALIAPPGSRLGPISAEERSVLMRQSLVSGVYDQAIDRVSAYESLKAMAEQAARAAEQRGDEPPPPTTRQSRGTSRSSSRQTPMEAMLKSTLRSVGSQLGRQLVRGAMGSLFGGSRRR